MPGAHDDLARASLNYKQIPYKTEWIEYPDIADKFKSMGIPANAPEVNKKQFTIPAVRLSDGRYIMDSKSIATVLEEIKPEPSLHLDSPYVQRTQDTIRALFPALGANVLPLIPVNVLNQRSADYFNRTREKQYGMSLQDIYKSDKAGENAWKSAEPAIDDLRKLLGEKEGPYVAGRTITYGDFILGGFWMFLKKIDEAGLFDRILACDRAFLDHWEAVKVYFERDSY